MARVRQTARKSTPGGNAPRKALATRSGLQCTFTGTGTASDLQPADFKIVARKEGFEPCWDLAIDLEPATLEALRHVEAPLLEELHPDVAAVLQSTQSSNRIRFCEDREAQGAYTLLAAEVLKRGDPVGFYAGTLMEMDKLDARFAGDLENSAHLYTYDLDPEALRKFGYDGPHLVISGIDRANEFNFTQDAEWMGGVTNNLAAALEWSRLGDGTPIPYVVFYAQRKIKHSTELLLDWGKDCWQAHKQIQVMKQASKSHQMHLQQRRLEALCTKHDVHVPTDNASDSDSDSGSDDDGHRPAKRMRRSLRFDDTVRDYVEQLPQHAEAEPSTTALMQSPRVKASGIPVKGASTAPAAAQTALIPAPSTTDDHGTAAGHVAASRTGTAAASNNVAPGRSTTADPSNAAAPGNATGHTADAIHGAAARPVAGEAAASSLNAAAGPSQAAGTSMPAGHSSVTARKLHCRSRSDLAGRKVQSEQRLEQRNPTPAPALAFCKLSSEQIADVTGCLMATHSDYSKLNRMPTTEKVMDRVKQAQGDLSEEQEALIESGQMPKVVVAEVLSLHHPVRWCTPPSAKAFTCLAAATIQEGEPFGAYVGKWWDDKELSRKRGTTPQAYSYGVSKKALRSVCPALAKKWRDLAVDASTVGNAARFLNCVWGHEDGAAAANAAASVVWSNKTKRPAVILFATRRIAKDEELLVDYGPEYCEVVAQELQRMHAKYYNRTTDRLQDLRKGLEGAGVADAEIAAAEREDVDIETLQFFQP